MDRSSEKRGFWDGINLDLFTAGYTFGNPHISPDGNYIAYTKTDENGTHLYLFHLKMNEHWQLTSDHSLTTGTAYGGKTFAWGANSHFIYFSSKGELFRVNINGGIPEPINGIDKSFSPCASDNFLLFSVEHQDSMSLGLLKILEKSMKTCWPLRIELDENFIYDGVFHKNGNIAIHAWSFPNMSWNGSKILLLSAENGYEKVVTNIVAGGDDIATSQPRFSPNGKHLSFFCDKNGWLNLWIAKSNGENARPLVEENMEHSYSTWVTGESNQVWLDNETIVFTRNNHGLCSLARVNIKSGEVKELDTKKGFYSKLSSPADGKSLVCVFEDYKTKGQIIIFNIDQSEGNVTSQVVANSGIRAETVKGKFVKPEVISFPTSDGEEAHGLLFLKEDKQELRINAPLIILVHGGPTGMSTNRYNAATQYFASRGYAVFAVNHRGSIGHGREYREILNTNWGKYDVEDSVDAMNFLSDKNFVNKKKSVIMGGSAGGYTVLMTLATQPGKFKAGVDLFGVSDNFLLAEETHYLESRYTDTLVGPLPEASANYFAKSPIFLADNIVDPLLILQGEDDPVVLKNQSELIRDNVKGKVEYKVYKGEGHGFKKRESLADMYPRIEKFIKKHVLYQR